jgi:hypothetical protein
MTVIVEVFFSKGKLFNVKSSKKSILISSEPVKKIFRLYRDAASWSFADLRWNRGAT